MWALSVLLAKFPLHERLIPETGEWPDSCFREWPEWQAKWLLEVTLPWKVNVLPSNTWEKALDTAYFAFPTSGSIWSYQLPRDTRHLTDLSSQKRWKHIPLLHHVPYHHLSSASLSGSVSLQQEIWEEALSTGKRITSLKAWLNKITIPQRY